MTTARRNTVRFLAVILTALCLVPGGAHFFELPHKMLLDQSGYYTVQVIYQGWAYFGIALVGAVVCDFVLVLVSRRQGAAFWFALLGFLLIASTLVTFFAIVFPTNQITHNWTMVVPNWQALRARWEYGHALSAILTFLGFCSIVLSALTARR